VALSWNEACSPLCSSRAPVCRYWLLGMSLLAMVFASYLAHAAAQHLHDRWTLASACDAGVDMHSSLPRPAPESVQVQGRAEGVGVGVGLGVTAPLELGASEASSPVDVEAQIPGDAQHAQQPRQVATQLRVQSA
jgi:hypothetical protein